MTASEKLVELIENDKLTDEQQDNLSDWGIQRVSDSKEGLIGMIGYLQSKTDSVDYLCWSDSLEEAVTTLYDLLDYDDDDFVIYEGNGITELDFDILNDVLDIG